ncbi:MAG: S46 family peptidase, partial [Saprospiraceae bacterium]|nr:S46 family peptidase [Saprospiraceae bacterium]
MKILNSFLLILIASVCIGQSNGGMWLPNLLEQLNEEEMHAMGMELTASDIYDINSGSLKDAVVHFGGFCTGEVISSQGLVLTNHHCGYGQIQSHSSIENNYLEEGFWAMSREEELSNPGLFVKFINKIEDVTAQTLKGISDDMGLDQRKALIEENIEALVNAAELGEFEEFEIKPFYEGNQFYAFYTISYPDVRLVGAPPSSIGKFGADTDNWVWPRHTGDFSIFRIYADKDNNPAEYSEDNVPFTPKHHLPINISGAKEGDFTMVFGFPGRTNEYLPATAVKQIATVVDPARVAMRDVSLKVMDKHMRADEAIKIKYASKFASIANYWKKWIGEMQGLERSNAVAKKQAYEKEFLERVNADEALKAKYGNLLSELNSLYYSLQPYAEVNAYHAELTGRNTLMLNVAYYMNRLENVYNSQGEEAFQSFKGRLLNYLQGQYKNYDSTVEAEVFASLIQLYFEKVPGNYLDQNLMEIVGRTEPKALAF